MKTPTTTQLPSGTYAGKTFGDIEAEDAVITLTGCTWRSFKALNCTGRISDCHGRNVGSNFIQLNKCHDMVLEWCDVINSVGMSNVEDVISIYQSDRIIVRNNYVEGGGATILRGGVLDPNYSGSGIMLDDGCMGCQVTGNVVLSTQNVGIGIQGGCNNSVTDNRILSAGPGCNGNVGFSAYNAYPGKPYGGHLFTYNSIVWMCGDGSRNDFWIEDASAVRCYPPSMLKVVRPKNEYAVWAARKARSRPA